MSEEQTYCSLCEENEAEFEVKTHDGARPESLATVLVCSVCVGGVFGIIQLLGYVLVLIRPLIP